MFEKLPLNSISELNLITVREESIDAFRGGEICLLLS